MSQYARLAPHYRDISRRKKNYLDAVDALIVSRVNRPPPAVLDVGAADGVRGLGLARAMGARRLLLCEPCAEMAALCRENTASFPGAAVLETGALGLRDLAERFDVILCLWNVLGHIPGARAREQALRVLRERLAPGGLLFLDVNNRHNAAAYGRLVVLGRRLLDAAAFDETRGDAVYATRIEGECINSVGHLFTPAEMAGLFSASGLRISERVSVNYGTGNISADPRQGQLLYTLEAL